jgi:hypothetical protein
MRCVSSFLFSLFGNIFIYYNILLLILWPDRLLGRTERRLESLLRGSCTRIIVEVGSRFYIFLLVSSVIVYVEDDDAVAK